MTIKRLLIVFEVLDIILIQFDSGASDQSERISDDWTQFLLFISNCSKWLNDTYFTFLFLGSSNQLNGTQSFNENRLQKATR